MISQPVDINMFSESVTLLSLGTGGFTRVDHFSIIQAIALAKRLFIAWPYTCHWLFTINLKQLLSLAIMSAKQWLESNHQFLETIETYLMYRIFWYGPMI